jgi:hypothetical protein
LTKLAFQAVDALAQRATVPLIAEKDLAESVGTGTLIEFDPQWSPQKRPFRVTSKPAINGERPRLMLF